MSPRETIYLALFDLVVGDGTVFMVSSRRLRHWSDVPAVEQPAFFMSQGSQSARFTQKTPTIWTMDADLYFYANTGGDMNKAPMSILNPIVDRVVSLLLPETLTGEQTLGGLVTSCRIDGDILTDEGVLGDQAVVIIPVKLFLPQ